MIDIKSTIKDSASLYSSEANIVQTGTNCRKDPKHTVNFRGNHQVVFVFFMALKKMIPLNICISVLFCQIKKAFCLNFCVFLIFFFRMAAVNSVSDFFLFFNRRKIHLFAHAVA